MIKGAIIGLGKMGLSHAAILSAHSQVNLIAVCDTSSFVLDAFKKFSAVTTFSNYKEMIDKDNLDFLFVATPTRFHYPMVKYALENGLHVFCEKPFSLTSSEGEELVILANKNGLINQVGYHNHFIGTFRELKRLLDDNIIGKLVHFTGEAYGPVITSERGGTWRSKPEEGGGCLYDYASHVLNLIQEIVGRPVKASGSQLKSIYSNGVEDAVYCMLTLVNGVSGMLSVNWSDDTYRKMSTSLTVIGINGKIICDATEIKIFLKEPNKREGLVKGWTTKYITELALPVNFYLRGEEYSAQIDYFINSILNKNHSEYNTFEQGLYTDKVVTMMIEDSKKQKTLDKIVLGNKQFFALNHALEDKKDEQSIHTKNDSANIKVVDHDMVAIIED